MLRCEGLGQKQGCASVHRPMPIVGLRAGIADRDRIASMGVVANQDVEVPEDAVRLRDEFLTGSGLGEVSGKCDDVPGPRFAEIFNQSLYVISAAVLSQIVGEMVMYGQRGAHLDKPSSDRKANASSATHPSHERRPSIQREVGLHESRLVRSLHGRTCFLRLARQV